MSVRAIGVVSWEAVMREWHFAQAALPANSFKFAGLRRGHHPGSARWSSVESCARTKTGMSAMKRIERITIRTAGENRLPVEVARVMEEIQSIVLMEGQCPSILCTRPVD